MLGLRKAHLAENEASQKARRDSSQALLEASILQERARCARIADGCACMDSFGREQCGCDWIAAKIRSGE
jgi:hypothetical protein